jgi:hypothetical protein
LTRSASKPLIPFSPDRPSCHQHRQGHELWRIATILMIRSLILGEPPVALEVRLLVRKGIHLLEDLARSSLPDFFLSHWPLFVIGLNSIPDVPLLGMSRPRGLFASTETDARSEGGRVDSLYSATL